MTGKKENPPKKGEKVTASPLKNPEPASAPVHSPEPIPVTPTPELTSASPTSISSVTKVVARKKSKAKTTAQEIPMDTSINLKRRRDSGEGASKKMCSGPSHFMDPLEGSSNTTPQIQPPPQQAPLQPPPPPPPPPPPQYRPLQHAPPKHAPQLSQQKDQ